MTQLLLVGAGHAHLEVIRRFGLERPAGVELTVVNLDPRHFYSGMLPGYFNGTYDEDDIAVDVAALVERVGGELRLGRASKLDRSERVLRLDGGQALGYDLVSFNLGSGLAGLELPGVREHALLIKPLPRVPEVRRRLEEQLGSSSAVATVVGGGAAGVELACSVATLSGGGGVRLVESSERILSGYGSRFRDRAEAVLERRGIEIVTGKRVVAVEPDGVQLGDGERLPSLPPVWLAGASASSLFRDSGLTTDERGFLLIDDTLRHVADERIFAVGDCATMLQYPQMPKAGVYSVRQGPVLWRGLLAALQGGKPPRYRPQRGFLSLLNTADGRALLSYKGFVSHSRLAWRLKDRIDRGFLGRYRA